MLISCWFVGLVNDQRFSCGVENLKSRWWVVCWGERVAEGSVESLCCFDSGKLLPGDKESSHCFSIMTTMTTKSSHHHCHFPARSITLRIHITCQMLWIRECLCYRASLLRWVFHYTRELLLQKSRPIGNSDFLHDLMVECDVRPWDYLPPSSNFHQEFQFQHFATLFCSFTATVLYCNSPWFLWF